MKKHRLLPHHQGKSVKIKKWLLFKKLIFGYSVFSEHQVQRITEMSFTQINILKKHLKLAFMWTSTLGSSQCFLHNPTKYLKKLLGTSSTSILRADSASPCQCDTQPISELKPLECGRQEILNLATVHCKCHELMQWHRWSSTNEELCAGWSSAGGEK